MPQSLEPQAGGTDLDAMQDHHCPPFLGAMELIEGVARYWGIFTDVHPVRPEQNQK
jgi:hypothetical protein